MAAGRAVAKSLNLVASASSSVKWGQRWHSLHLVAGVDTWGSLSQLQYVYTGPGYPAGCLPPTLVSAGNGNALEPSLEASRFLPHPRTN